LVSGCESVGRTLWPRFYQATRGYMILLEFLSGMMIMAAGTRTAGMRAALRGDLVGSRHFHRNAVVPSASVSQEVTTPKNTVRKNAMSSGASNMKGLVIVCHLCLAGRPIEATLVPFPAAPAIVTTPSRVPNVSRRMGTGVAAAPLSLTGLHLIALQCKE